MERLRFRVGPGGFPGTGSQFDALLPLVASAMLAGPAVAGLLMTVLLSGTAGLRELLSRLFRWRVGVRWYIAALLPAPLLAAAVLCAVSLTSPIFTAPDKTAVLLAGITAGLPTSYFLLRMLKDQIDVRETAEQLEAAIRNGYTEGLY